MIRIAAGEQGKAGYGLYGVAGQEVAADVAIPCLAPFGLAGSPHAGSGLGLPLVSDLGVGNPLFEGDAWLAEEHRFVQCVHSSAGYSIDVDGVGSLSVGPSGDSVLLRGLQRWAVDEVVHQLLLGPGLILALSLRGIYCLHASAVARNGAVTVFLGDSGTGKSTLATFLVGNGGSGWRAVADDILPVVLDERGLWAFPRYPQLKLPVDQQPSLALPERLPVHTVFVLENAPSGARVTIRSLHGVEGAIALVRHTVATKLFDRDLLARHLRFCADAAAAIDVRRLSFKRNWSELVAMRSTLEGKLLPGVTVGPMAQELIPA